MATYEELMQSAEQIRTNELPESNTHQLVGQHLKNQVEHFNKEGNGIKSLITELGEKIPNTNFITCSTLNSVANKTVNILDFKLSNRVRLLVKMTNANTADNANLSISSPQLDTKPLYYNGERASATNTWKAGAVLDIYYDGAHFQATDFAGGSDNDIIEDIKRRVSSVGYIVCDSTSDSSIKSITIQDAEINTYTRLLVCMTNSNSVSGAFLSVSGKTITTKKLIYNGRETSINNTWEAGDVLDIYYDGTNFQATDFDVSKITEAVSNKANSVGYITCDTSESIPAKTVTAKGITELTSNIRLLIRMANANTAASGVTLNINGLGAKVLYYNNTEVTDDNTWEAGDVLDIYYDGTSFYANNMEGGSQSSGGDMILEWNTNISTTRKQVKQADRKQGMQISYKPSDSDWINEQYIGELLTDTEWSKDANWSAIPSEKELISVNQKIADINVALSEVVDGTYNLEPSRIIKGVWQTTTGTYNTGGNSDQVIEYNIETLRGVTISVTTNKAAPATHTVKNAEGSVISYWQGAITKEMTIPENAKTLALSNDNSMGSPTVTYTIDESLKKQVEDVSNKVGYLENTLGDLIILNPTSKQDGYIGFSNIGGSVNIIPTTDGRKVYSFDVSTYNNSTLHIKAADAGTRYVLQTDDSDIVGAYSQLGEEFDLFVTTGAKKLYVNSNDNEGELIVGVIQMSIPNKANAGLPVLINSFDNPKFEDSNKNWVLDGFSVVDGVATKTVTSGNIQIRQNLSQLAVSNGDKVFVKIDILEAINISYIYAQYSSGSTSYNSTNYSFAAEYNRVLPLTFHAIIDVESTQNFKNGQVAFQFMGVVDAGDIKISVKAPVMINLTKVFGKGLEPASDAVALILNALPDQQLLQPTCLLPTLLANNIIPRNGGYVRVNDEGAVEIGSPINPNAKEWSENQNSYGSSSARVPIINRCHGQFQTDAMFSVVPTYGRWGRYGYPHADNSWGAHVFEGWNFMKTNRFTIMMGTTYENEANIIVYRPREVENETDVYERKMMRGTVRVGSDWKREGFKFYTDLCGAYGDILFYLSHTVCLQSPNGSVYGLKVDDEGNLSTVRRSDLDAIAVPEEPTEA